MPADQPSAQSAALERLERVLLELAEALPAALKELGGLGPAAGNGPLSDSIDDHADTDSITLDEAAEYTGYSLGTIRAAATSGRLKSTQPEAYGRRRTTRADCDAWLQEGTPGWPRRRRKP